MNLQYYTKNPADQFIYIQEDDKPVQFTTDVMRCVFGIEQEYNNTILKLEFINNNTSIIDDIQRQNIDKLNQLYKDRYTYKSQIVIKNVKYKPLLICKIPRHKDKLLVDIFDKDGFFTTSSSITPNTRVKCLLQVDNIWLNNKDNTAICKFKIVKLWCV